MTLERYRPFIDDWAGFLEAAARPEPTVFRVRTGRISEAALILRLEAQGHRVRSLAGLPGFHEVVSGPVPISMTVEHWLGLLYVQQASTGVAAPQLGPEPGERVLDLCSAPGGKTTHIAELMRDTGCLVASEISENRIRGLLGNVYKLGHTGIMVVAGDGREFPGGALFDRVLVDAPCTGEGTLRRRAGRSAEPPRGFIGYVTRAQRGLLERAVRLTRPGGTILYVTCTFAPEENEAVVSDALDRLPVELEPLRLPVPHAPGLTHYDGQRYDARLEGAARIYPHHFDSGGLFLAKLVRLDDGDTDPDAGWSPVPRIFPEVEADGTETPAEPRDAVDDELLLADGVVEVQERFEVRRPLDGFGWIMRGGRAWMHTLEEWPLASWAPGSWRPISVGIRAIEFDSQRRARPTNDLLRLLGDDLTGRVLELEEDELDALLRREPVATGVEDRGPYALRYRGDPIGRGAVTKDGLKTEIPKARSSDLRRIRAQHAAEPTV